MLARIARAAATAPSRTLEVVGSSFSRTPEFSMKSVVVSPAMKAGGRRQATRKSRLVARPCTCARSSARASWAAASRGGRVDDHLGDHGVELGI